MLPMFPANLNFSTFRKLLLFFGSKLLPDVTVGHVILKKVHFRKSLSATRRDQYDRQRGMSLGNSSRNGSSFAYGIGQ